MVDFPGHAARQVGGEIEASLVKVLGIDDRGKVRLSMRVVDQETGQDLTKEAADSPAAE